MRHVIRDQCRIIRRSPERTSPAIYLIDSLEHPFAPEGLTLPHGSTVISTPIRNWNDALTPWPAERLYREEPDFGGLAQETLSELVEEVIPAIQYAEHISPNRCAICGYSLAGLFSLYAFISCDAFDACACVSGSVWYEGWVDHLRQLELDLTGRFAFLSVGTKEKRGGRPIMRSVQANMEECAGILQARGCVVRYETGPGNHLQYVDERMSTGLAALDGNMTRI